MTAAPPAAPVYAPPDREAPAPAEPRGEPRRGGRARRAHESPKAHDGWTFVLIPPGTNAVPRTLRVSVRRLRLVVASFVTLLGTTVAVAGVLVLLLSMTPPTAEEGEGVRLGVLEGAPVELSEGADAPSATTADSMTLPPRAGASVSSSAPSAPAARPSAPAKAVRSPAAAEARARERREAIASLPVIGRITSGLSRARLHPVLGKVRRHRGVDIAAPLGTHIIAPAAGRVIFSGRRLGFGRVVEIDHGRGVVTRYAHCRTLEVQEGDRVQAGQTIATVGASGLASGPHLHYEIVVRGKHVDPLRVPLASLLPTATPAVPSAAPSAPAQEEGTGTETAPAGEGITLPPPPPVVVPSAGGQRG